MYLVETVGRAIPCFRHGTDYILNPIYRVLWRIMQNINLSLSDCILHPSTTESRQPMSRYTAVGLLHIPLGIALSS